MMVHNYSAGPCILPKEVFEEAAKAVLNFDNSGLSILEMSHRSENFVAVMEEARQLVRDCLNVPDTHDVLFLQGGASLGFYIAAINFMKANGKSAYISTGEWARKAAKEAKLLGNTEVIASSEDRNYSYIPKTYTIPTDADYLHFTSNNTIFGTQFKEFPQSPIPVICDMSSDIFSREINVADFDLIYAGAQKNLGPAGATLYIFKKDALGHTGRNIPSMLDLSIHAAKDSMFNTPPVFSIYVSMLTLRWLKKNGGVHWISQVNEQKARLLYDEIDRNPLFEGTAANEDRSNMNACFILKDEKYKARFDAIWNAANISGIKGHRSVGGYRASMYNALPLSSVQALVGCMQELEKNA